MHDSQYIEKELMAQVHICLNHRKAREGRRVYVADVLNDIIRLGLEKYASEKGIILPHKEEVKEEGSEREEGSVLSRL